MGTGRRNRRKNSRPKEAVSRPAGLDAIVGSIVETARPEKIILFGSAARGRTGPHSDIDLLVIKSGKFNHWRLLTQIYRRLGGEHAAVDVVLATPEDIQRYGDSPYLVFRQALEEGTVVYEA